MIILNLFLALTVIFSLAYLAIHIHVLKRPKLDRFETSELIEVSARGAALVVSLMFLIYLCLPIICYVFPQYRDPLLGLLEPSEEQITGAIVVASFYGLFEGLKPFFNKSKVASPVKGKKYEYKKKK